MSTQHAVVGKCAIFHDERAAQSVFFVKDSGLYNGSAACGIADGIVVLEVAVAYDYRFRVGADCVTARARLVVDELAVVDFERFAREPDGSATEVFYLASVFEYYALHIDVGTGAGIKYALRTAVGTFRERILLGKEKSVVAYQGNILVFSYVELADFEFGVFLEMNYRVLSLVGHQDGHFRCGIRLGFSAGIGIVAVRAYPILYCCK